MKELCEAERPREKMLALGPASLGNGELLAILLRNGTRKESALDLAQRMLAGCDGHLSELFNLSSDKLRKIPGIGPCKACSVQAALELGRRFLQEESSVVRKTVSDAGSVYDIMIPKLKGLRHEECWVLFLNAHNYLISSEMITKGSTVSTIIDIGQIVRKALDKSATGIILVHNHPTGNPHPSKADVEQTDALHTACKALGIDLLDHVIVSDGRYFSFSDDKMCNV